MRSHQFLSVLLLLAATWVVGCNAQMPLAETVDSQAHSEQVDVAKPVTEAATEAPTEVPTATDSGGSTDVSSTPTVPVVKVKPPAEAKRVVELAMDDLIQKTGVALKAVRLVSVEAVQWSDASLGCPKPDMVYAQVITPGFLVVLEAMGDEYEYHTDVGRFVVPCQPGDASGE